MKYCINPKCEQRENSDAPSHCQGCGTVLLIHSRYRVITRLRGIDGPQATEIFEVEDTLGGPGVEAGTHQIMKVLAVEGRDEREEKRIDFIWREARILKEIDYPGIPKVQEDGFFKVPKTESIPEFICLVLQKIEGQTLDQWLEENGPISEDLALDWLNQLARSLHEVHTRGYFHRDIKPSNIILQPNGQLVLIDFGAVREVTATFLAKVSLPPDEGHYEGDLEVTNIFTIGYAPPEQVMGKGTPQSDFYALGTSIVHMLTGIHPRNLPADKDSGLLIWRDKAKVSKPFAEFIDNLLSITPGKRPVNSASLLLYLESSLPRKLKHHKQFHDRRFQIGAGVGIILALVGSFILGTNLASSYFFSEGSKNSFKGEYEKARSQLELAIQLNPKNVDSYTNLAAVCQNIGDDKCVFDSFEKALKIDPNNWPIYSQLGGYFDFRNQNDEAAKYYRKAIRVGGDKAVEAYNNLARIQVLQGNYEEAIKLSTRVIKFFEGINSLTQEQREAIAAGLKNRGWAKLEQQKYAEALSDLNESANLGYQNADVYCLLEKAYSIKKDNEQANLNGEYCLTRPYNTPEAYEWRVAIISRLYGDNK